MTSPPKSPKGAGGRSPRKEAGTTVRFEVTLEWLHDLRHRIERRQLDDADWPFVGALVSKQIARAEDRQTRMLAKIIEDAATSRGGQRLNSTMTLSRSGRAPSRRRAQPP